PRDAETRLKESLLVYSSRPERGLEHLVGLDGRDEGPSIMELLARSAPGLRLKVCGYDNTTPATAELYAQLALRCRSLPNVEWLGPQSKGELASLMSRAWLHVYPTEFEEVSCITAMETQCAGTPILTTPLAALPETLDGAGVEWVPPEEDPAGGDGPARVNRRRFADTISRLWEQPDRWRDLSRRALEKAPSYSWSRAADAVEQAVEEAFARQCSRPERLARHLLRHGDIMPLRNMLETSAPDTDPPDKRQTETGSKENHILARVRSELNNCYTFASGKGLSAHYRDLFDREARQGRGPNQERLDGNVRFEAVSRMLSTLTARKVPRSKSPPEQTPVLLDYGCGHGHYTMNLARRFPRLRFIGVDLVGKNIHAANKWAAAEGLENVEFIHGALGLDEPDAPPAPELPPLDFVLAAEVLEHVPEPWKLADLLAERLRTDGAMIITTPYGPWESLEHRSRKARREHLHHLETDDLRSMFGHHPGFHLEVIPAGQTPPGEPLGSLLTCFKKPRQASGKPDWETKQGRQRPRETLSVCMLARPDARTLGRTLESVAGIADEIIIGVDTSAGEQPGKDPQQAPLGRAGELAAEYGAVAFEVESPLRQGFHEARNQTLARAGGDWVLWIDDDEELLWPERLPKYLRDNGYQSYALPQHHFAVEPGGLIKTDYPGRLFRNRLGIRFFGFVHEHPEKALNQGPGHTMLLPDVAICHNGYMTEEVRRKRFFRNLPLMRKDREQNETRVLGRFLWIRDLAHLNRFEHEQTGQISPRMLSQAREAVSLWRGLLKDGHTRLAVDSLPYYSECAEFLGGAPLACRLDLGLTLQGTDPVRGGPHAGPPPQPVQGRFINTDDVELLTRALLTERSQPFRGRYV
ncbi:MAG: methyltransferase domain-containing protein, partial [Deltaproteobacteria bacterium]|nr:methyltransferase domain-containing protein [Deltaproteobacteria bacterium]